MKLIERSLLKKLKGGLAALPPSGDSPASCCSVTCPDGKKRERECGDGTMCSTSGTNITCGTSTINVCA